ncbi:DUF1795 domain-containing protein [Paraburkholderia megapolitana]|uniref:DUF1795 domain-containing protein n=2 Tax=Paraburkholderia megapolitana TaxID=420953 RepID=A0A1I3VLZ1_9BURK|nr:DUF1795 domain-containing protein [Paraburkholderia megapolitana]SFJ96265.1 hypothetical protein SAMN05192543_11436 [Paraburkholderia megapolitana]
MSEYRMNDAAIELPAHFTDKTFHIFSVDRAGVGVFTFVVSRAPMEAGDTIDTFVKRLVSEMRKALPHFELKLQRTREVDGETAREIDYRWISDGAPLHQRQTVVMSPLAGDKPLAISFIGTCPKAFSPEWTEEYAKLVDSATLRRKDGPAFVSRPLDESTVGVVFVLHELNGTLYSLSGMTELFRHNIAEMFRDVSFYGATGAPLVMHPAPDAQKGWHAPDGREFLLWTADPRQHRSLSDRLSSVKVARGITGLSAVDDIRAYLSSVAETLPPSRGEST